MRASAAPPSGQEQTKRRFISVSTKLAAYTVAVLTIGFAFAYLQLSQRERQHVLESKERSATMVSDLFVQFVSPRLDFFDEAGVEADAKRAGGNAELTRVSVFDVSGAFVNGWARDGHIDKTAPALNAPDGSRIGENEITVTRAVIGASRERVGTAVLEFSLDHENDLYKESRRRLLLLTGGLGFAIGAIVLLLARRQIIAPLRKLSEAARRLERGEPVKVSIDSRDEIGRLAAAFNMMGEAVVERTKRMQKELEIARHIQSTILPTNAGVRGFSIASSMNPATEVGGDYYDVLPADDGCWIGIGDVSGHGVNAGLIMLMIQGAVSTLVTHQPEMPPRQVANVINRILFDNIRKRMKGTDHATMSLFRCKRDGGVVFAGAHEPIIVYRASSEKAELIDTPGTWVGMMPDVSHSMVDTSLRLEPNDLMVLYTDGVIEARNAEGEFYGMDRLTRAVEAYHAEPVETVRSRILEDVLQWTREQDDDITLVVVRRSAESISQAHIGQA